MYLFLLVYLPSCYNFVTAMFSDEQKFDDELINKKNKKIDGILKVVCTGAQY